MEIVIAAQPEKIFRRVHELVRMAFPGIEIKSGYLIKEDNYISLEAYCEGKLLILAGRVQVNGKVTVDRKELLWENEFKARRWARIFVYHLLCRHTGVNINAYGILTGVRPVKLVHKLLDQGMNPSSLAAVLKNEYQVSAAKIKRLTEVALNERPFLSAPGRDERVSIYIGIPFCPSRCFYCSFPGAAVNDYNRDIRPFIKALRKEMSLMGEAVKQAGLKVQSVYIGGGTPTSLNSGDFKTIFDLLHHYFVSAATEEIVVEAGRPDTLSFSRLEGFKQAGVTRVCINPQTMNDRTLKRIGRRHNSYDIVNAVGWVRQSGIAHINMDVIVGLPGEELEDYSATITRILDLHPDNITIHTLAAKKGSKLVAFEGKAWGESRKVQAGLELLDQKVTAGGYKPYYLYRQKYMRTDAENTGYSLPACFCLYNMQMIEERQTIIGLGGGAASKFVFPSGHLVSVYNPSNPVIYSQSVDRLVQRKVDNLMTLN